MVAIKQGERQDERQAEKQGERQGEKQGERQGEKKVLGDTTDWHDLYFYQKADAVYQLTFVFCQRFLPPYGDRTLDQMVQAARSGKQNIVEGIEDGKTSTEMELKLLNVARASLQELREDYHDFLHTRGLCLWDKQHPRYDKMLTFCRSHNTFEYYAPMKEKWNAEEFCNTMITLCHLTDRMMCKYLDFLQKQFVEQGGIKERMYAARTGYRQEQDRLLATLKAENQALRAENNALKAEIEVLKQERE